MKVDIEKLYNRFNKKWIGSLYAFAIFFIFSSFGAIIGFALGKEWIYAFLLLLAIGYAIAIPIGFIKSYLRKNYKDNDICKDVHCSSYAECDKIHCYQFYKYTDEGIIKRR